VINYYSRAKLVRLGLCNEDGTPKTRGSFAPMLKAIPEKRESSLKRPRDPESDQKIDDDAMSSDEEGSSSESSSDSDVPDRKRRGAISFSKGTTKPRKNENKDKKNKTVDRKGKQATKSSTELLQMFGKSDLLQSKAAASTEFWKTANSNELQLIEPVSTWPQLEAGIKTENSNADNNQHPTLEATEWSQLEVALKTEDAKADDWLQLEAAVNGEPANSDAVIDQMLLFERSDSMANMSGAMQVANANQGEVTENANDGGTDDIE